MAALPGIPAGSADALAERAPAECRSSEIAVPEGRWGQVCVVVPAFNEGPSVAGVVAEIRLTLPSARVVVVDDGSTDDTAARVHAYGGAVRVLSTDGRGVATARNAGVRSCGVTYGFQPETFEEFPPDVLVDNLNDLRVL